MSEFQELKNQVLEDQPQVVDDSGSWLEAGEEVEVIWTDANDKPYRTVGRFQGISVPEEGGPVQFVLNCDGDEVGLYSENVVGLTKQR
jgi:hypothetical protein